MESRTRDAVRLLAVLWSSALALGVLVATVPSVVPDRPPFLVPLLLVAAAVPYGLLRPAVPVLWGLVVGLPTVVGGLARGDGWQAVLPMAYALVGVYAGALVGGLVARRRTH